MKSIWNNEFILIYPSWDGDTIDKEILNGSYRDAIHRAKFLVTKVSPPKRRREVEIYLGDCFLKSIG